MKRIIVVHESAQYDLALRFIHMLIISGFDAVSTHDLFVGNTGVEIREDIGKIYSSTAVFIVLADAKLFQSDFYVEIVHDAKRLKKSINVLVESVSNLPAWFIPQIIYNGRPGERLWNQVIESVKPFVHNQPPVLHPEIARLYNLH